MDAVDHLLKPGDVIILGENHSGYVNAGGTIDHFLQDPHAVGKPYDVDAIPFGPIKGTTDAVGGLFIGDTFKEFLAHDHFKGPGLQGVQFWRNPVPVTVGPQSSAIACPGLPAAAAERETLTVPNTKPMKLRTSFPSQKGGTYTIKASGEVSDWDDHDDGVDAVWCYATWRCGTGERWEQLRIDGKGMSQWVGPPTVSHVYQIEVPGTGAPFEFYMLDAQSSAGDNKGAITVTVTRVK